MSTYGFQRGWDCIGYVNVCGIYLNTNNVCEFLGKKKCVKLLKFVKPFSDKKLQSISFWQIERKIYIFIYICL